VRFYRVRCFGPGPNPIPAEMRHEIACFLAAAGVRPSCSTGIDGLLTRGYGRLDEFGFWEYPL